MIWQIQTLNPAFEKRHKKGKPVPRTAWKNEQRIETNSYVEADKQAKRLHKNKVVHTYTIASGVYIP